jgi:hypothetical protein
MGTRIRFPVSVNCSYGSKKRSIDSGSVAEGQGLLGEPVSVGCVDGLRKMSIEALIGYKMAVA